MITSTNRILIRPLEEKDIELMRQWRNNAREFFFNGGIISSEAQRAWYESYLNKDRDYMFTAVDKQGNVCGFAGIYGFEDQKCEFGRIVTGSNSGQGIGTEMTNAICKLAFDNFDIDHIEAEVMENNVPSNRMLMNAGFMLVKNENRINFYEKRRF